MCLAKQVCRLTEFHKSYSSASVIATFLVREMDLSGIIAAIPTPFRGDQQQSVDYENLKQNLFKWEKIPLKGYLISGSLGERPFLTNEEKLDIIKTVRSTVDPSKLIIAGTTCESTEHTYQLSEAAAKAGADAVLIMVPHYYKSLITDKLIIEHFTKLADLLPIPIIIYNNPMTTSIDISLNAIELLANHPNICGIKDVTVAKLGCIVERTRGKNFQALAASVGYLLPSLLMGCVGSMNGLSSVLGEAVCELYALSKAHEWDKAMEIQRRLILPDLVCSRELGCNGLKAAMEMLGYYGGLSRKPLLPLNDEQKSRIRNTLQTYGFLS